jgi:heme-degrading monooxygenase HmoA
MRVKAGMESELEAVNREMDAVQIPGHVATYVYQMDRDSREFFLAVVFESREAYHANANSPEQHQRFMRLMQVLEGEPEWNDGVIVNAAG